MRRISQLLALLLVTSPLAAQIGCRACGTCHDYDPPVANCSCNACGEAGGRSGSVSTHGYAQSDQPESYEHVEVAQKPSFQR